MSAGPGDQQPCPVPPPAMDGPQPSGPYWASTAAP